MLRDLAKAISITTFKVWKNIIGKGGIKDFFKGGGIKEGGGLFEKGEDKYPLRTMSIYSCFALAHQSYCSWILSLNGLFQTTSGACTYLVQPPGMIIVSILKLASIF